MSRDDARVAAWVDTLEPFLERWFQPRVHGLDRVCGPPALWVGNHSGGLLTPDTFALAAALYRHGGLEAVPQFLVHSAALEVFRPLLEPLGAVPASHASADALLQQGAQVMVYPGGDFDAMRPWYRRNQVVFGGRRGYVRLALRRRVPIVPVAAVGGHQTYFVLSDNRWLARALLADRWLRLKAWPLAVSVPWGVTLGPAPPHFPLPSTFEIEILEPIALPEVDADDEVQVVAIDAMVRQRIGASLRRLARLRRARQRRWRLVRLHRP